MRRRRYECAVSTLETKRDGLTSMGYSNKDKKKGHAHSEVGNPLPPLRAAAHSSSGHLPPQELQAWAALPLTHLLLTTQFQLTVTALRELAPQLTSLVRATALGLLWVAVHAAHSSTSMSPDQRAQRPSAPTHPATLLSVARMLGPPNSVLGWLARRRALLMLQRLESKGMSQKG